MGVLLGDLASRKRDESCNLQQGTFCFLATMSGKCILCDTWDSVRSMKIGREDGMNSSVTEGSQRTKTSDTDSIEGMPWTAFKACHT
jgi:hypothetical protein